MFYSNELKDSNIGIESKACHWLITVSTECSRDVPVNHPVLGRCRVSHYPVLPGPGKIIDPSKFIFCQSKILKRDGVGYQSRTQLVTTVLNRSQSSFKSVERVG